MDSRTVKPIAARFPAVDVPLGQTDDVTVNDSGHVIIVGWGMCPSTDTLKTWIQITSGLGSNVRSTAIDAKGHLYAGSWGEYDATSGIFRSTDNGDSWTPVKLGFKVNSHRNTVFNKEGHILVGSWGAGVWKSVDDGETWTQHLEGLGHVYVRNMHITSDGIVMAGTENGGIYRSGDDGET